MTWLGRKLRPFISTDSVHEACTYSVMLQFWSDTLFCNLQCVFRLVEGLLLQGRVMVSGVICPFLYATFRVNRVNNEKIWLLMGSLFAHGTLRTHPYIGKNLPFYMGRYHWIPWPILAKTFHFGWMLTYEVLALYTLRNLKWTRMVIWCSVRI